MTDDDNHVCLLLHIAFIYRHFPDSVPLLGEEELVKTFMNSKGLPMVSVKVSC